ncbi:sodium-dependent transporter [Clostridium sp. D2Q-14]|uniref:sodium-dependent transporter n=1 Tax=Anaeromonas gelatinilytica TaxID=2683194 RepID=UPI00193B1FC7|nr:sodium-dependent transporter [Anaeromonas gelatinilytica]MBS4534181.1 sodium-dependent transporter [Anaeromonas gelatinilytica]
MRDKWSSNLGFILAASGSAIGLGNLWKFPYNAGANGGGAFVLLYLLFLILIGIPLMISAITLGRKTQLSVFGAYKSINPKWSFVGGLGVICGFIILAFYSTVGGWVIYYLKTAILGGLNSTDPIFLGNLFGNLMNSPVELLLYQFIFMLITMFIVLKGISNGIEKASKIMMPSLFIIIIIIIIRSITLNGSLVGIEFLFIPDFSKINMDVAMNALGQVFFSISIGMGTIVTYGSYLDKKDNLLTTSSMIPLLDTLIAILAGLAILPAVFALGFEPTEGPGLMFITLPAVFSSMPLGNLFCILFFLLVLFAALTSSISMLEVAVSYFVEEKKKKRVPSTVIIGIIIFLLGIPASLSLGTWSFKVLGTLNFFDLYDKLTANILLTTGAFLLTIFIGWVLKPEEAIKEIESSGIKFKLANIWTILIKYLVPIAIGIILINSYIDFIKSILNIS